MISKFHKNVILSGVNFRGAKIYAAKNLMQLTLLLNHMRSFDSVFLRSATENSARDDML